MFATVACIKPGPGNTLMMTSGLRRGVVGTLPLLLGLNLGFMVLLAAVGAGPHCNDADKAALRLARLGRPVKLMIGGVTGWLDAV